MISGAFMENFIGSQRCTPNHFGRCLVDDVPPRRVVNQSLEWNEFAITLTPQTLFECLFNRCSANRYRCLWKPIDESPCRLRNINCRVLRGLLRSLEP